MISEQNYLYCSNVLLMSSFIYLILFTFFDYFSKDLYKANYTQSLITISISLLILAFLIKNGFDNKELDSTGFYIIYILAIPLIYHLLYYILFVDDVLTKMRIIKIYMLIGVMFYLSLVWYNTKNLLHSGNIHSQLNEIFKDSIKVLTIYY